jgi:hypothetical protein
MGSFTKCDSCDKIAAEEVDAFPRHGVGMVRSDGWSSLDLDVFRKVQAKDVHPLDREFAESLGQAVSSYHARRSHLDICPSCTERVVAALGPAGAKVSRDVSPKSLVIPVPKHAHRHPSVPFDDEGGAGTS